MTRIFLVNKGVPATSAKGRIFISKAVILGDELRLLALADPILTDTRYGMLRKAFLAIRN